MDDQASIPVHIGYIVDGNRRWAKKHGLPTYEGHLAGYNALKDVIVATTEAGVKFISLYTFSTENWKREDKEVNYLLKLTHRIMKADLHELLERGIRVRFLGIEDGLSEQFIKDLHEAEEKSKNLTRSTVLICFNYGGQREIADAARKCVLDGLKPEDVTIKAISERMYAPDVPPVDIVVRTSGEQRLSNFMLWNVAYSELLFLDKFWPEMTKADVTGIIEEYGRRGRRFGG